MRNSLILLASVATLALTASAYAADTVKVKTESEVERDAKGNLESHSTTRKTNAAGTTTKTESSVDVDVDSDGVTKTTETSVSKDPKGLFNKTGETVKSKVTSDGEGNLTSRVNATKTTAEGTKVKETGKVKVDVNSDGGLTKTQETTTVRDPKGLFNKTTQKSTVRTEINPDGTKEVFQQKKVNGEVVSEQRMPAR